MTITSDTVSEADERIRRLEVRLVREHGEVPPSLVHEWIERARARFGGARVQEYVPLLVARAVRVSAREFKADVPEVTGTVLTDWARTTARRLLAAELPRRWSHTAGVARRAGHVARVLPPKERELLVAAAWLHDIGYASEVADTGLHSLDGARYLRRTGVSERICSLVAHHSGASAVARLVGLADELAEFGDDRSRLRDALWYADMSTGPDGQATTVQGRLAEIRQRRGPDDPVVRALAVNGAERLAAVRRTHRLLRRAS